MVPAKPASMIVGRSRSTRREPGTKDPIVENGVRFVELYHADWDTHANQDKRLRENCRAVDQPIAALIRDLKQRGLLEQTLVVCGSEFGRTPMLQGDDSPE